MAGRPAIAGDLNQLSTIFRFGVVGDLSDSQLLHSFRTGPDGSGQAAFLAIVERHGPMARSVCRQVLRNPHDAQDAFQATFLVMARKAGTVQNADPWPVGCMGSLSGLRCGPRKTRLGGGGMRDDLQR